MKINTPHNLHAHNLNGIGTRYNIRTGSHLQVQELLDSSLVQVVHFIKMLCCDMDSPNAPRYVTCHVYYRIKWAGSIITCVRIFFLLLKKKKKANGACLYGPDRVRSPHKSHVAQPKKSIQIFSPFRGNFLPSKSVNVLVSTF